MLMKLERVPYLCIMFLLLLIIMLLATLAMTIAMLNLLLLVLIIIMVINFGITNFSGNLQFPRQFTGRANYANSNFGRQRQ